MVFKAGLVLLSLCSAVLAGNCDDDARIYDTTIIYTVDDSAPGTFPVTGMDSERNTLEYRTRVYDFFKTQFDIDLDAGNDGIQSTADFTHMIWKMHPNIRMTVYGMDTQDHRPWQGRFPTDNAVFADDGYMVVANQDFTVHGAFGGVAGKTVQAGAFILSGEYRLFVDGEYQTAINYYSDCPVTAEPNTGLIPVNCRVESTEFGNGITRGVSEMKYDANVDRTHVHTRYFMSFPKYRDNISSGSKQCDRLFRSFK